jgi:hypothetical protein
MRKHILNLLRLSLFACGFGCTAPKDEVVSGHEIFPQYLCLSTPLNDPNFAYWIDLGRDGPTLYQGKLVPVRHEPFGGFDPKFIVMTKTAPEDIAKFFSATQFSPPIEVQLVLTDHGSPPHNRSSQKYFGKVRASLDGYGVRYRMITNLNLPTILIRGEIFVGEP